MTRRARQLVLALAVACGLVAPAVLPATNALADSCAQPTHVWFQDTANGQGDMSTQPGGTVTAHTYDQFILTGVVKPGTGVEFDFYHSDGAGLQVINTTTAGGNCVINVVTPQDVWYAPGVADNIQVNVTYDQWENNQYRTITLGYIQVS